MGKGGAALVDATNNEQTVSPAARCWAGLVALNRPLLRLLTHFSQVAERRALRAQYRNLHAKAICKWFAVGCLSNQCTSTHSSAYPDAATRDMLANTSSTCLQERLEELESLRSRGKSIGQSRLQSGGPFLSIVVDLSVLFPQSRSHGSTRLMLRSSQSLQHAHWIWRGKAVLLAR
jgi:hypothetical protein